ncbi:class I SAM-dependent methyltransferase [Streptomyces sp. NK15101]|uniref:class I SAM-dependent methyltransferase n=1 Tax=Streptomyces sp. NK15101 TaxID=2873261 RepID=UPI001CED756F|nr:methyltransferase domain-containing protein [Streptomyces sp. NK15101]
MTPRTTSHPTTDADRLGLGDADRLDTVGTDRLGLDDMDRLDTGDADRLEAEAFDSYDDVPERLIGYPAVFHALGIGSCAVRTVLDYGCGPGKVATRVVEASDARVVAVDVSPGMLGIARARRPHPRIDHRLTDDGGLGFLADGSVDAAMACFVFTTTGDIADLHDIAAETHRVLRPGGRFAVLDANPRTTGIRFSTFRRGEPGRVYTKGERRRSRLVRPDGQAPLETFDHHWPCQTYLDVLGKAGFTDLDVHEPVLTHRSALLGGDPAEAGHPPFLVVSGVKQ